MKVLVKAFSAMALAMVVAGAATAQPGPGNGPGFGMHRPPMERMLGPVGGGGRWWNNPKVIERLKLTDDQRKEMDQILLEHREKLIDMRAGVEKAELEMEPLVGADQPNEQGILAQIDKIAQARAELEKANARFLLAIRAKLTPDQFKELLAVLQQDLVHLLALIVGQLQLFDDLGIVPPAAPAAYRSQHPLHGRAMHPEPRAIPRSRLCGRRPGHHHGQCHC